MTPRPVYHAHNATEATLIHNWLSEAGIESRILGGETQAGAFDLVETNPVIIVSEDDVERAQAAIRQFHAELQTNGELEEMSDAEGQFNWPICPQCDELREATCQQCNKTSTEFSAEVDEQDLQVFCLACGSPVSVDFSDHCRYCQFDFAAEEAAAGDPDMALPAETSPGRALAVVIILGLLGLAVVIWLIMSANS